MKIKKKYPEFYNEVLIKLKDCIIDIFSFYKEELEMENFRHLLDTVQQIGYMLTGADIDLFKKNCLAGQYELRFRLTPPVFIEWLKTYIHDRHEQFANNSYVQKKEMERAKFNPAAIEKISEIFKPKETIIEKLESKPDPVKKLVDIFIRDFKNECRDEIVSIVLDGNGNRQKVIMPCREYIEYDGKNLGINEYIAARYENYYNQLTTDYAEDKSGLTFSQFFEQSLNRLILN